MQLRKTLPWICLILAIPSLGCYSKQIKSSENQVADATIQDGSKITVTGEVTRLHKTNVDKSGRNPKYMVQLQMTLESIDGGAGINLASPIVYQDRESELISYLGRLPKVGERLTIQSYTLEKQPQILPINGARFATPKTENISKSQPAIPRQSNLPTLDLGSHDNVLNLLDSLYQKGGTQAVAKWVEQELQPGRKIIYRRRIEKNKVEKLKIYDRSIWRLDAQESITNEAILPPLTDEKYGDSEFFANWSMPLNKEPFLLRLRIWRK